jgi:hypothetical protein
MNRETFGACFEMCFTVVIRQFLFWMSSLDADVVRSAVYLTCGWEIWRYHGCEGFWRWRQQGAPKRWYPTATLHGVTARKTVTWTFEW